VSEVLVQDKAVRRKGPVVTFSGMDGTGKTTLALVAADELRRQGYRVRILRIYPFSIISVARWMLKSLFPGLMPERMGSVRRRYSGAVLSLWRQLAFRVDCITTGLLIRFLSNRGMAVICDRYVYDSLVALLYDGACDEDFIERLAALVPTPDAAFLLRANEKVICSRKGVSDLEECRLLNKIYLELNDMGDFWIVDTDDERSARSEVRGILSYSGRRW